VYALGMTVTKVTFTSHEGAYRPLGRRRAGP
jgi:hypothetical protein